jgi:hypothetical protein
MMVKKAEELGGKQPAGLAAIAKESWRNDI